MTWKHWAISLGWVAAIAVALLIVNRPITYPDPPPGWTVWRQPGAVRAVVIAPDGVFVGGFEGVYRLADDGAAERLDIPDAAGPIRVNAMVRDARGRLWAGHTNGLSVRRGDAWRTLTEQDGLPDNQVVSLLLSSRGLLYVGTRRGLAEIAVDGEDDALKVRASGADNGLPPRRISAIIEDTEGRIWLGTTAWPEAGVVRLDDGAPAVWSTTEGLPHANVTSLLQADDGRIWVGCGYFEKGGAAVLARDGLEWKIAHAVPTDELAGPNVRSLFQDRRGRIWLGHEFDGVTVRLAGRTIRRLTPDDGLPAWEVMVMTQEADGTVWLGTLGGAVRLQPAAADALFNDLSADGGRTQ